MRYVAIFLALFAGGPCLAQIWPARTVPLHLAEPAVSAAQAEFPENRQDRYSYIDAYCQAILDTWRHGNRLATVTQGNGSKPADKGRAAGLRAKDDLIRSLSLSPADFGYLIKDMEGSYTAGFEKSEFVAAGTNERFHLHRGSAESIPEGKIRIKAWVSPETELGFGHFNRWRREIIVIQTTPATEGA